MSWIEETERQLEAFGPLKRTLVTAGTALAVLATGWFLWLEPLDEETQSLQMQAEQLAQRIARIDLRGITARLDRTRHERLLLEEDLAKADAAKRYLQSRIHALEFVWFDPESSLRMLNRILKRSVELGVRIDSIENVENHKEVTPLIEKNEEIRVEGAGRFADILRLVQYIESFQALLKTRNLHIWLDEEEGEVRFAVLFDGYGEKR